MPLRKVTVYGAPLLRKQSKTIEVVDQEIKDLIRDMKETMVVAGGVGLAAPQVGVSKMLFTIDWRELMDEGGKIEPYLNPEILEFGDKVVVAQEGCLSLPDVWAEVARTNWIRVRYMYIDGEIVEEELSDFPARVFQHEYDHLCGILFIDRLTKGQRKDLKVQLQAILDGKVKGFDGTSPQ